MDTSGHIYVASAFGSVPQQVQHGWEAAAAAGDSTLVAAKAHTTIRLLSILFLGGASTAMTFKSGSTAISPAFSAADDGGAMANYHPHGHLETRPGEALVVTLGAGDPINMIFTFVEVPTGAP